MKKRRYQVRRQKETASRTYGVYEGEELIEGGFFGLANARQYARELEEAVEAETSKEPLPEGPHE